MLVSIIIPAYNCQQFIKAAVNSALFQTYKPCEVIVCDDASTDKTYDILTEFGDQIKLLRHDWNAGPAGTLNDCIEKAKGDFIKWLSADDMLYPEAVERLMEYAMADSEKNRERTIYYSNYDIINVYGRPIGEFREPDHHANYLWQKFFGNGSSSLIHKKVFEKCGLFDESLRHSEDYEFWLRATQLYSIRMKLVPEKLLMYRRHPGQLTNSVGGSLDHIIREGIREKQGRKDAQG